MKRCLIVGVFLLVVAMANCGGHTVLGTNWIQATAAAEFPIRQDFTMLSFNNKLWVIGGTDGIETVYSDVWFSSDGVTWTLATDAAAFGPRWFHSSAVFDNRMWVIGGMDEERDEPKNDVWYSSDGVTWTQATADAGFTARYAHTSVANEFALWVIAGAGSVDAMNDVWYSRDGVAWTEATGAAAFPARRDHSSVSFDGRLWVIGGIATPIDQHDGFSDVWSSIDGVTWTMSTDDAFVGRIDTAIVVADGKMWMMGGLVNGHEYVNEVWSSSDGAAWTQLETTAAFTARAGAGGVYFADRLWIAAGKPSSGRCDNEVWYAE